MIKFLNNIIKGDDSTKRIPAIMFYYLFQTSGLSLQGSTQQENMRSFVDMSLIYLNEIKVKKENGDKMGSLGRAETMIPSENELEEYGPKLSLAIQELYYKRGKNFESEMLSEIR